MAERHETLPGEEECTYSDRRKLFIVLIVSIAGFISPFAISIYIPTLRQIEVLFHVSPTAANITVAVYMISQGLSPLLWAPLSDTLGRRPVYLATFFVTLAANIGLSVAKTYWLPVLLRFVQAFGGASAIAVGAGTIAGITQRGERGTYMGYYSFAQYFAMGLPGAIFVLLTILTALVLAVLALFLNETKRSLVCDGSAAPTGIYRCFFPPTTTARPSRTMVDPFHPKLGLTTLGFHRPLRLFVQVRTCAVIIAYALVYATFYLQASALPTLLDTTYHLQLLLIGICFLPRGIGSAVGTIVGGRILDWTYRRAIEAAQDRLGSDATRIAADRLRPAWIYLPAYCGSLSASGWCIQAHAPIAVFLLFQFFIGMFSTMYFININTLLVDLYPNSAASATAAVNVGRCLLGAVAVCVAQTMILELGAGWTMTVAMLINLVGSTLCQVLATYRRSA